MRSPKKSWNGGGIRKAGLPVRNYSRQRAYLKNVNRRATAIGQLIESIILQGSWPILQNQSKRCQWTLVFDGNRADFTPSRFGEMTDPAGARVTEIRASGVFRSRFL